MKTYFQIVVMFITAVQLIANRNAYIFATIQGIRYH